MVGFLIPGVASFIWRAAWQKACAVTRGGGGARWRVLWTAKKGGRSCQLPDLGLGGGKKTVAFVWSRYRGRAGSENDLIRCGGEMAGIPV
jgi:hypothetical protein